MARSFKSLLRSEQAAVAPTVALSLFGLIAAGGLAFDYARLAGMDTELQAAADMAALAAASQLDRTSDSITRATNAIDKEAVADRLVANSSLFANDGKGSVVEIGTITFCSDFDDTEPTNDAACDETTDPLLAAYVMVTTEVRTANYALTPIVAAFSGTSSANAVAGVYSAMCNVAPLMVCAPAGENNWPTEADYGRGIRLKPATGPTAWAPGNYGLLDFGNGFGGVFDSLMAQGENGCRQQTGQTSPGNKDQVTDATNTRFDVYEENNNRVWNKPAGQPRCSADGRGCPAPNTRKDMVLVQTYTVKNVPETDPEPTPPPCGSDGTGFPGTLSTNTEFSPAASAKGFPRDNVHFAAGGSNVGDGVWGIDSYLTANHPGATAAAIAAELGGGVTAANLTRYDVYRWEKAQTSRTNSQPIGLPVVAEKRCTGGGGGGVGKGGGGSGGGGNPTCDYTITRQCTFSRPKVATQSYTAQRDRRVLPIVSANCDNLSGSGSGNSNGYVLLKTFNIFLVEPSWNRGTGFPYETANNELYGEIIGPGETGGGVSEFQQYAKTKPYLVR